MSQNYKYGTIEYEINDTLKIIMRMDSYLRILVNTNDSNLARMCGKSIARNVRQVFPELLADKNYDEYIPVTNNNIRLIKH